ncbi:hypothetical protein BG011_004506 [Mortierella polycephala]|uniref:Uncharacterized protein n=1 Tax=Mortierella polycephala TaxID=41804 RepID=A0A9P6PZJ1_9FUNG|nr:hypothetical protein BG011_004506 [Mortierella polycephala]
MLEGGEALVVVTAFTSTEVRNPPGLQTIILGPVISSLLPIPGSHTSALSYQLRVPATMSSILNVLRSAPTPTRHFTSLKMTSSVKNQPIAFNPEHHPIVLQQLVKSLNPNSFMAATSSGRAANTAAVKKSLSDRTATARESSPVEATHSARKA